MEKTNPFLKQAILEMVHNQIKDLDPPETKQTYDRLRKEGHSDAEARRLIGCAVSSEMFNLLNQEQPYDHERFVNTLNKLPRMPWEG